MFIYSLPSPFRPGRQDEPETVIECSRCSNFVPSDQSFRTRCMTLKESGRLNRASEIKVAVAGDDHGYPHHWCWNCQVGNRRRAVGRALERGLGPNQFPATRCGPNCHRWVIFNPRLPTNQETTPKEVA